MSTVGTVCSDYTCNGCGHEWTDTKQKGYEDAAYIYGGCPVCSNKDCSHRLHKRAPRTEEEIKAYQIKIHRPGSKVEKPPKGFVEVLNRIHDNHKGMKGETTINRDW